MTRSAFRTEPRVGAYLLVFLIVWTGLVACEAEPAPPRPPANVEGRVLVLNEGNFRRGNASLSRYDPASGEAEVRAFPADDAAALDVLQSATALPDGRLLLVSNNTNELVLVDADSLRELARIPAAGSPRYALPLGTDSVLVTDLYAGVVSVVALDGGGRRDLGFPGEGAELLRVGQKIVVAAPEARALIVLDAGANREVDRIDIDAPVTALALRRDGLVLAAAGARVNGGRGVVALVAVDDRRLLARRTFVPGETSFYPRVATGSPVGDLILQQRLHRIVDSAGTLGASLVDEVSAGPIYYGLGVDPVAGDLYVADAAGFVEDGRVLRFGADLTALDTFTAGPLPSGFVFLP